MIEDLVRREVAVIAAPGSTPAALAAKAATTTIPVVFVTATDPVAARLVASLNRPGGNLTGVTALALELGPKQLELLREVVPTATVMALLVNPASRVLAETQSRDLQATAGPLGLQLHVVHARTASDFDTVFATLGQLRAGGLVIGGEALFTGRSEQLAALALRHAMPAIYQFREFAAAGGLMSYGANLNDAHRLAGVYTGRILGGQKPADLPVQQSTKLELIINLPTAKALGLEVPPSLLARADEVIDETARVHHAARRCGCVAARGKSAAVGDAGDRVSSSGHATTDGAAPSVVPQGTERNRLRRGQQRDDRIPLGRW